MALAGQDGVRIDLDKAGNERAAPASGPPFIHTVFLGISTLCLVTLTILSGVAVYQTASMAAFTINLMHQLPANIAQTAVSIMSVDAPAIGSAVDNFADTLVADLPTTIAIDESGATPAVLPLVQYLVGWAMPLKALAALLQSGDWTVPKGSPSGVDGAVVSGPYGSPITKWIVEQLNEADIQKAAASCVTIVSNLQSMNFDTATFDTVGYTVSDDFKQMKQTTTTVQSLPNVLTSLGGWMPWLSSTAGINFFPCHGGGTKDESEQCQNKNMQTVLTQLNTVCTAMQSFSAK